MYRTMYRTSVDVKKKIIKIMKLPTKLYSCELSYINNYVTFI